MVPYCLAPCLDHIRSCRALSQLSQGRAIVFICETRLLRKAKSWRSSGPFDQVAGNACRGTCTVPEVLITTITTVAGRDVLSSNIE